MKRISLTIVLCLVSFFLSTGSLFASGSGSHSHNLDAVQQDTDDTVSIYKDSQEGVDAYLEFFDVKDLTDREQKDFFLKCHVRAFLKGSRTGEYLQPLKLVLRATIGHDQFGEATVFLPTKGNRMQADLFVKNKGEQHYLLIAEIEGVGVKEFHFHHTF